MSIAMSVMAAEVQALVHGFYYAYAVKDPVEELIYRPIILEAMICRRKVFNVVDKDGKNDREETGNRRAVPAPELRSGRTILPGAKSVTDALLKQVLTENSPLFRMMKTNRLELTPQDWAKSRE